MMNEPAEMTRDDVMRETVNHVRRVGSLLITVVHGLQRRAVWHDHSKFSSEEYESFARETPGLKSLTYGTPEYKAALARIKPAIEQHYKRNRHHPEHHANGMRDMTMLDMIEMLADWKAAGERHADGDLRRSIEVNADRFGYGDEIKNLLLRTAVSLMWCEPDVDVLDHYIKSFSREPDQS